MMTTPLDPYKWKGGSMKGFIDWIGGPVVLALALIVGAVTITLVFPVAVFAAEEIPVKEVLTSHIGWEVDKTALIKGPPPGPSVCTIESHEECQPAKPSSEPVGFSSPSSVAGAPNGNIYVADSANQRVQELTPSGEFVLMFGREVNETKDDTQGATEAEKNLCTALSHDKCKAGVQGTGAGELSQPGSITVDPLTGNVYVEQYSDDVVMEFTGNGEFVLALGKEVNETEDNPVLKATTTQEDICTAASKDKCKAGEQSTPGSTEPDEFKFNVSDNLLASGGPEDLLYVGDEHRIHEFKSDGTEVEEIRAPLEAISSATSSIVSALAVDGAGNVYAVYEVGFVPDTIYEFDAEDKEINKFLIGARDTEASLAETRVAAIAVDSAGRLAVSELEDATFGTEETQVSRGTLYAPSSTGLHLITGFVGQFATEFRVNGSRDIAFDNKDALYATVGNEIIGYSQKPVSELKTSLQACESGLENGSSVVVDCSLKGTVNPWKVPDTEVWFQWGPTTRLGHETSKQTIGEGETSVPVAPGMIDGLRPDATYYYQLIGYDQNVTPPEEELRSAPLASFSTEVVAPRIIGVPSASFIGPSSAVLFDELNPENTNTRYAFQYVKADACASFEENCPGISETVASESPVYGDVGATMEATGLQPATTYRYRLSAVNSSGQKALDEKGGLPLSEGSFTTAGRPVPQATTGPANSVTATSAILSGTVQPGGLPATYAFELGVSNGTGTQYGVVFSGPAGSVPAEEKFALTGLQPGVTYAYRITISSGYIENESHTIYSTPVTFTTPGQAAILEEPPVLPQLATPHITFPKETPAPKKLTRAQQLSRALKTCEKQPKDKRAACKHNAHKKFDPVSKARKSDRHGKRSADKTK